MPSLASFLPPHLVRSLARRVPRELPHVEKIPAALLLADVSGFTALTERLQAKGREGAEEIATIINQAFRPAIRAIEKHQGSIVSFGGDALFAIFPGGGAVGRALAAAEGVQEAVGGAGSRGTIVAVSQAIHYGNVTGLHLEAGQRRHYLVGGPSVMGVARSEGRASAGQVRISPQAKSRLGRESRSSRATRSRASADVSSYLEPRLPPALRGFRGEYRRAAILFLETRGFSSTRLSRWFPRLVECLEKHDGMLLKSDISESGTRWLCTFGIPTAHERDPDRAARAALELRSRIPPGLEIRGGLHAGTVVNVVIGTASRRSFDIMGDDVNTAARALAAASWGDILVTEACRRTLIGVETEDRGRHEAKGKSRALHLQALLSAGAQMARLRVSAPMIGRDRELGSIVHALQEAADGRGGVVGVKGEAGLGKSRLKYESAIKARALGFRVHEGRAISYGGTSYGTIASLMRDALGLPELIERPDLLVRVQRAADRLKLAKLDRDHLAEILGVSFPDSGTRHLPAKDSRLNKMIAIQALFRALGRESPHLLVLEDMHWADESTREAVDWLARETSDVPLLVLLLYRPGYDPPRDTRQIDLGELTDRSVDALLEAHLGKISPQARQLVRSRAEGNPFYVEELARHLLETEVLLDSEDGYVLSREPRIDDLPEGVEALIAGRLDRLPREVKRTLQVGAIIGRTFPFELLRRLEATHAEHGIRVLQQRELVFVKTREPLEYIFKHALTRDVAYSMVLHRRRRHLHRRVAEAMERLFRNQLDARAALVGHHWEQAQRPTRAVESYRRAADWAIQRFAHEEAERLCRNCLRLLDEGSPERLEIQLKLASRVLLPRGAADEAIRILDAALDAARRRSNKSGEASVLRSLGVAYRARGESTRAIGAYHQSLRIPIDDPHGRAVTRTHLANLEKELGRLDVAVDLYRRALRRFAQLGDDGTLASALSNMATVIHDQGRLDQARRVYRVSLHLHRKVRNLRFEGHVLGNLGSLFAELGDHAEARVHLQDAIRIHRKTGNRRNEAIALTNLGMLTNDEGHPLEAQRILEQALDIHRSIRTRLYEAVTLASLGQVTGRLGEMDRARSLIESALSIHGAVGGRRMDGIALQQATRILRIGGDLKEAERRARRSVKLLTQVGDEDSRGNSLCELGHVLLAQRRHAKRQLDQVHQILRDRDASAIPELRARARRLETSQTAFESKAPLICGSHPDQITPGEYRWLRDRRPDAIPPEIRARLNEDGTLRPK